MQMQSWGGNNRPRQVGSAGLNLILHHFKSQIRGKSGNSGNGKCNYSSYIEKHLLTMPMSWQHASPARMKRPVGSLRLALA